MRIKEKVLDLAPLVIGSLKHEGDKAKIYLDAEFIKNKGYLDYFMNVLPDCKNICGIICNFCNTLAKEIRKYEKHRGH